MIAGDGPVSELEAEYLVPPRCPVCSKVHERTRIGRSLSFVVHNACDPPRSKSGGGKKKGMEIPLVRPKHKETKETNG